MTHRISSLLGLAALAATISPQAAAQEYSNGGKRAVGRVPAILTPVEAFGVHPPGLAPADAGHSKPYVPYYAPLSPVASSTRWRPWSYRPLFPYYTPYYTGYCPHRLFNPPPRPYGSNGWGKGPMPDAPLPEEPGTTPLNFGPYTSVVADDTTYWNMGGNGLVPYGAPQPDGARPPDLVDEIQASRPHRRGRSHFLPTVLEEPVVVPSTEAAGKQDEDNDRASHRRPKSTEPIPVPPGEASPEQGTERDPDVPGDPSDVD